MANPRSRSSETAAEASVRRPVSCPPPSPNPRRSHPPPEVSITMMPVCLLEDELPAPVPGVSSRRGCSGVQGGAGSGIGRAWTPILLYSGAMAAAASHRKGT